MTLEAMKMENEIMAPGAGTVKKIYVAEGKAVQQGEALIDIA
jgi:biotin carboxyl carrier protein